MCKQSLSLAFKDNVCLLQLVTPLRSREHVNRQLFPSFVLFLLTFCLTCGELMKALSGDIGVVANRLPGVFGVNVNTDEDIELPDGVWSGVTSDKSDPIKINIKIYLSNSS